MIKKNWLLVLTIFISSIICFIIGKNEGWSEAFRDLTDSSACKISKRKYYHQIR